MNWTITEVIIAIIVGVVMVVLWRIERTARERAAREARIERVTRAYIDNNLRDANMSGALLAGVLSFQDSTEVSDFCRRVNERLPDVPVLPGVYRERIPESELLEFFRRLQMIENWRSHPDLVERLIDELRSRPEVTSRVKITVGRRFYRGWMALFSRTGA